MPVTNPMSVSQIYRLVGTPDPEPIAVAGSRIVNLVYSKCGGNKDCWIMTGNCTDKI